MQAIVDSKCSFIDIVVRWHCSVHDSRVLRISAICGSMYDDLLLGDSGRTCFKRYFMTPFANPDTPAKQRFNYLKATRVRVKQTFGQ